MPNYHHLLLATEFSETDLQIAQRARDIADQNQAKLSLVHILDNIPMPDTQYGTVIPLDQDSKDPLLEAEKTQLNDFAEQFRIPIDCRWLIWGIPKQEVIPIAHAQQVDLIVVGCHSRHGLALLFDSTADGLLHRANCDILAVRLSDD
jgi:universal stress protein A